MGLVSAVFAFADGYFFRPLPIPGADRAYIVRTATGWLKQTETVALRHSAVGALGFGEWSVLRRPIDFHLMIGDRLVEFYPEGVTPGFRETLPIPLLAGRDFTDDDYRVDDPVSVWLSYRFWMKEFGGDRSVIGRTFATGRDAKAAHVLVIGILAPTFSSFDTGNEPPAAIGPERVPSSPSATSTSRPIVTLPAGLAPGIAASQIEAVLQAIAPAADGKPRSIVLDPLLQRQVKGGRPTAAVLFTGAMLVLLLAAITIVHLLLARGVSRAREVATRAALGASRWQVVKIFLLEGFTLGAAGVVGGLIAGAWFARVIQASIPMFPTSGRNLSLVPMLFNVRVMVFASALGLIVSCVGALWPASRALRRSFAAGTRTSAVLPAALPLRLARTILASELAVATMVMAGTVFIGSGIWRYLHQPLGFDHDDRYWFTIRTPGDRPLTNGERDAARTTMLSSAGVAAAAWDGLTYLQSSDVEVPNRPVKLAGELVAPGAFEAWHLRLEQGRWISKEEFAAHTAVGVVDREFAAVAWPGTTAIGQQVRVKGVLFQVVGVIEPRKRSLVRPPPGEIFVPVNGTEDFARAVVWMPRAGVADLSRVSESISAAIPGAHVETRPVTLEWLFLRETGEAEFQGPIVAVFGVLAFLLAGIGVFGLTSYLVEQRRHEFGIRFALGAQPRDIWRNVTGQSVIPALAGLVTGLIGARALETVVRSSVFGWDSSVPLAIATVTLALIVVVILAALGPARRAMRIDPAVTLRGE